MSAVSARLRGPTARLGGGHGVRDSKLHSSSASGPAQSMPIGIAVSVPGTSQDYSSTNFELLGLLLMKAANVSAWDQLDQRSAVFTTE